MAVAVAGRTTRPSEPARIETDLAEIWRTLGREAPVARAALSNLVVFCDRPGDRAIDLAAPLDVPVEEVAGRHPSRIIVLHHDRQPRTPCAAFAASVAVLTFGPPQSRYGVEEIAVRSVCGDASLPSIVRGLALGGLPTSVWWTDDFSEATPLDALVAMGRQLVFDSRLWRDVRRGMLALEPTLAKPVSPDLVDLNWRRLTTLRQALLHAIDAAPAVDPERYTHVRIRHRLGEAALAWLLAGWLEAQLKPFAPLQADVDEGVDQGDVLAAFFGQGDPEISLFLRDQAVVVSFGKDVAPLVVALPRESEADAVAATLRTLGRDVCLHQTLAALIRRFTAA
jgi:glucose-6-phosphate dehydrogenase assembly protein OpcA